MRAELPRVVDAACVDFCGQKKASRGIDCSGCRGRLERIALVTFVLLLLPADIFLGEDSEAVGAIVGQALLHTDHLWAVGEGEDAVLTKGLRL